MIKHLIILFVLTCMPIVTVAQNDRQCIRQGNRLYRQQNFSKAEVSYRKAVAGNANNSQAIYNLGCALMSQQKDSAAIVQFEKAGKIEPTSFRKAKVYHNIGVVCQRHQMFGEAIQAYKESLRNNPNDNETRYNLALCQRQQKKQKGGGGGGSNKNKNKNKDKKQNNDKKNQNSKDNQHKQKQPQPKEQMSKDNAEQLLNAAVQEEKGTQKRLKKAMQQPRSRRLEKNW